MKGEEGMRVEEKRLDELRPYENNPRNNDGAVPYVADSIREFGFRVPLVIDRDGVIVAGHTRYKAAQTIGLETVPCVVADDLTDEQVRAFRLADNKVAEASEWDEALLYEELAELSALGVDADALGLGIDPGSYDAEEDIPGDNGFEYSEEFAINVVCDDEQDQRQKLDELRGMGYRCKAVVV